MNERVLNRRRVVLAMSFPPRISPSKEPHRPRHFDGGVGGFLASVVRLAEAPDFGLLFVLQEQDLVNDRDVVSHLNVGEGMADSFSDMLGVGCLTAQDDANR